MFLDRTRPSLTTEDDACDGSAETPALPVGSGSGSGARMEAR